MPDGLSLITQDSFDAGLFQSLDVQRIPANGAYDVLNGLLDSDESVIYRRGGSAYKSTTNTAAALLGLWDGVLVGARRTLFYTATRVYVLDTDDVTPLLLSSSENLTAVKRPIALDNMVILPTSGGAGLGYAGSKKAADYTDTLTFTAGDAHVTGTGFLANVDPGMFLPEPGHPEVVHTVIAVNSDTDVTLDSPAVYSTVSVGKFEALWDMGISLAAAAGLGGTNAIGTAASRLLLASNNDVFMTNVSSPFVYTEGDYHRLGAPPLAAMRLGSSAIVFALDGVWEITNINFDLTDFAGNPQQQLRKLTGEIVLWGELGLTEWNQAVIVPATDNVYLLDGISAPVPIGRAIRDRYRAFVNGGYRPGQAVVFRDHYFLPILDGANNVTETLVCRLDGMRWTRWDGHAGGCIALASRVGSGAVRDPELLGANGLRLLALTECFSPSAANKAEADGTVHEFDVITRDFTLGTLEGLVRRLRLWCEAVAAPGDDPGLDAAWAMGPAGSAFTAITGAGGESSGDAPQRWWRVTGARGKRVRFRFRSTDPWASLKVKALDVFVRVSGRS